MWDLLVEYFSLYSHLFALGKENLRDVLESCVQSLLHLLIGTLHFSPIIPVSCIYGGVFNSSACVHAMSLQLCLTLCDPMEPTRLLCPWRFSRQEYWRELPCPPPGDLPSPETEPMSLTSLALAGTFFATSATWEAHLIASLPSNSLLILSLLCILCILGNWFPASHYGQADGKNAGKLESDRKGEARVFLPTLCFQKHHL